ncbi:unnamed protein product [Caenorhabditis sp. 36 PRJEB53466]|nr:unnamed protein product [Caenorhabditis sp. 36 PRJEB53466]
MQHEDYVKTQWYLRHLLETDRKIVGRKRRDVQRLIHQYLTVPEDANPLAVVPSKPRRILFRDEVTSEPLSSSANARHVPRVRLDWDANWPSMESFYQQMSLAMGSLTNSELAFAMCNPTKQITFHREDPVKKKELEDEMKDWLPKVGQSILGAKNKFHEYYPPVKPIIRNKENIVWGPQYRHLDVKTLRTVMEHELAELGMTRIQKMVCSACCCYFPSNQLFLVKEKSVAKCTACWDARILRRPTQTLFDLLVVGIAEKWAEMVGKRIAFLYGEWDERLTPMVRMLKENVLLAGEIAALLKSCNDPEELADACEAIIVTTMVFYLEYIDFRRSCEALMSMKPDVTYEQLFNIFAIYFPNRAKNVKTGDFL